MPMRHTTIRRKRRRKRRINLFTRKRIKNAYRFKKMRFVLGGDWFSDLFPKTPDYKQQKELIEAAKIEYLSSHSEPPCPDEYLKLKPKLLDNPAYFFIDYPGYPRRSNAETKEVYDKRLEDWRKKDTWRTWAVELRIATRDAAGLSNKIFA